MLNSICLAFLMCGTLMAQFTWKSEGGKFTLLEQGKPVLTYNEAEQLPAGVPEDRKRCCYLSPLYTPAGVVVTDDFPKDHYHHRGLFWGWPHVNQYDIWMLKGGIHPKSVSAATKSGKTAQLDTVNTWEAKEGSLVRETSRVLAHPSQGDRRALDVQVKFEALQGPVVLAGSAEAGKSYGGLNVRFAPRTDTVIRTNEGVLAKDSDRAVFTWAELEGNFNGQRARVRIIPEDPKRAYQWCLRHYGFVGAAFPGRTESVKDYTLEPGEPLTMHFRIELADVR